jgi:hypothetical protein
MIREAVSSVPRDSVGQAAHAIVQLINSRPHSPRHDEIVAIIEKFVTSRLQVRRQPMAAGLDEYGPDLTKLSP